MSKKKNLYFRDRKQYWHEEADRKMRARAIALADFPKCEDAAARLKRLVEDDQAAMGIGWPTAEDGVAMGEVAAETLPTESLEDLIKQTDRETLDLLAQWTAVEAGEPTPTRTAQSLLLEAAEIVSGDRARTHGPKERSFELIAKFWDLYLVNRSLGGLSVAISAIDVAQMMVLLKVARSVQGEPTWDHYLDAAGYSAVAGEIFAAQKGRK